MISLSVHREAFYPKAEDSPAFNPHVALEDFLVLMVVSERIACCHFGKNYV